MKTKNALHELIRSLTQNEKRYFKIYASRHTIAEKNNYVKLFEAIEKQKDYDEDKLRSKIRNESFKNHFAVAKNYLYNLILECLDIYHKNSSIDRQLSKYTNIARVLADKKLDKQSIKLLEKAKKLSIIYNRFENIILLTTLRKNIDFDRDTITVNDLQQYYQDIFLALDQLHSKIEYAKVRDLLLIQRRRKGPAKNEEEYSFLTTFNNNLYFKDSKHINSIDSTIYYMLAKIEYARIARDKKKGKIFTQKLISLFDNNPNRISDNLNSYIYTLNVFVVERLYDASREEASNILKKILSIPSLIEKRLLTNEVRVRIFETYYTCITDIALAFKDYTSVMPHIQKAEKELIRYEKQMTPSFNMVMKANFACVYFGMDNYKKSLYWCNKIINEAPSYREDMIYTIRILNLLTHFELGNQLILPGMIKSTYRYLYQRQRIYQFENILLKYFRLFLKVETKEEQLNLFIQLKDELDPLVTNKLENLIFNDIDLLGWIDKKIKQLTP